MQAPRAAALCVSGRADDPDNCFQPSCIATEPRLLLMGRCPPGKRRPELAIALLLMLLAGCVLAGRAHADCRYTKFATLPVKFENFRPLLEGTINGTATTVLIDTGATKTTLSKKAVERLRLRPVHADEEFRGWGGESNAYLAQIDEISFGPVHWRNVHLLAIWQSTTHQPYDALLGADFLFQSDVEFALAESQLRFFSPTGCADEFLGYWDAEASVVALESPALDDLRATFVAELNGQKFRAMIDSGAMTSFVDRAAAERAGVTVDSPETLVTAPTGAIGPRTVPTWMGQFKSLRVGGETIRNPRIAILETSLRDPPEIVLGADFLRAHRVLFAFSQRRMYFSYLGGTVFSEPRQ